MEAFINGISAISPQRTFQGTGFLKEIQGYSDIRALKCTEPAYNDFLDPMTTRRMSRIVKIGVCAALQCLKEAAIEIPDAIITGTGLGCIEDTEKFLTLLYTNEERLLNPTPFIQSTHNTVSAAIALMLKCNGYNNTYVHRGFSFESALLDALMLLHEETTDSILVGGLDELTNNSLTITDRLGFWKKQPVDNLRLMEYKDRGSLAGEGAAFFLLGNRKNHHTIARIHAVETFFRPGSLNETEKKLAAFVKNEAGGLENIDIVLLGMNGDTTLDTNYHYLMKGLFAPVPCAYFKHLCGEYDTASSFALYLACAMIREQTVPEAIQLGSSSNGRIGTVLIYNHVRNANHSMFLVSAC